MFPKVDYENLLFKHMEMFYMNSLRLWFRIILFLSSYTPLFILFLFRNFSKNGVNLSLDGIDSIFSLILIILVFIPNIILFLYIRSRTHTDNPRDITIKHKEEMNYIYIEYLITYIIPFLSFSYADIWEIASILLLLLVICYVYVNSNLLYVNLMLNVFGYNLFKIKDTWNEYMLISKRKRLILEDTIKTESVSESFIIDVGGEEYG